MNIEDIKIGETYNIQVKVEKTIPEFNSVIFTINGEDNVYTFGIQDRTLKELLSPLPTPPKYDPNRLFKKGDIVRLKEWNGRCPEMYSGTNSWFNHPPSCKNRNLEVREDEKNSKVKIGIIDVDCAHATVAPCYLELVTPVSEHEPYSVKETMSHDGWQIVRDGLPLAIYDSQRHPNAKAAAEEERDRLNAEYRKDNN